MRFASVVVILLHP